MPTPSKQVERGYHYTYQVVTSNGAGIHSKHSRCSSARAAMERIARNWSIPGTVFEIQRVRHLSSSYGRQYSMRQRSRWVEWNPHRDHVEREPDWIAVSPDSSEGGEG